MKTLSGWEVGDNASINFTSLFGGIVEEPFSEHILVADEFDGSKLVLRLLGNNRLVRLSGLLGDTIRLVQLGSFIVVSFVRIRSINRAMYGFRSCFRFKPCQSPYNFYTPSTFRVKINFLKSNLVS